MHDGRRCAYSAIFVWGRRVVLESMRANCRYAGMGLDTSAVLLACLDDLHFAQHTFFVPGSRHTICRFSHS
jgi:hypothetical protein